MSPICRLLQIAPWALLPLQHLIGILEVHIKCCKLYLQPIGCMTSQFTVRTADQLPTLLQAFRKEAGLTQREVALESPSRRTQHWSATQTRLAPPDC